MIDGLPRTGRINIVGRWVRHPGNVALADSERPPRRGLTGNTELWTHHPPFSGVVDVCSAAGSGDMKSGVTAWRSSLVQALVQMGQRLGGDVLLQTGERRRKRASGRLRMHHRQGLPGLLDAAIIMEPSSTVQAVHRVGALTFRMVVQGHSISMPGRNGLGVSAIEKACYLIWAPQCIDRACHLAHPYWDHPHPLDRGLSVSGRLPAATGIPPAPQEAVIEGRASDFVVVGGR